MPRSDLRSNSRSLPRPLRLRHGVVRELDLLGRVGLDHRTAPRFKYAAHPDAAALKPFGFYAGSVKDALIATQDDDAESLRPARPEIHIYSAAALAHRQDLAFDDGKTTPFRP